MQGQIEGTDIERIKWKKRRLKKMEGTERQITNGRNRQSRKPRERIGRAGKNKGSRQSRGKIKGTGKARNRWREQGRARNKCREQAAQGTNGGNRQGKVQMERTSRAENIERIGYSNREKMKGTDSRE